MKKRLLSRIVVFVMILILMPVSVVSGEQSAEPEFAWVLIEINDYENADKWAASDDHESYVVTHSYSRALYSASTTFEGEDIYDTGLGGTLAVKAAFSGVPDIIYPGEPVSLKLSFTPTKDTVNKLSFTASAHADFDQWDVGPGGVTGRSIEFENDDGESRFTIIGQQSVSHDEILTAALGAGSENSRIALRLLFYFSVSMGTNYVYEWKQVGEATVQPTVTESQASSTTPSTGTRKPATPTPQSSICRFADLHGEVNVRPNDEDDDAYIFAELSTPLHHNDRIRTLTRSGAIIQFSDLSSYVMKEDTIIVLDIANEKESKIALVAGRMWTNLKKMVKDGSMEVEMSQAVAGIKGTTLICEELDGVSVVKVIEGTVVFTSKVSGERAQVSNGQMVTADSNGLGEVTTFDIDGELEAWDEKTQQLTAEALAKGKRGSGLVVTLFILAIVMIAAVTIILLIRKRKPATSAPLAYPQPPVYQDSLAQNERGYNSSARFCGNCGNLISTDSKFCEKCGQHIEA